jgi:hypothetical protein
VIATPVAKTQTDEIAKAVASAYQLCSQNAIAEQGVVKVCNLVRDRALEKMSNGDAARKSPELPPKPCRSSPGRNPASKSVRPRKRRFRTFCNRSPASFRPICDDSRDAAGTAKTA